MGKVRKVREKTYLHMNFGDDPGKPVRAAGVVLYRVMDGHRYYLFQVVHKGPREIFEDFGGKVELCDKGWHDTLVREAVEESNGQLDARELRARLSHPTTEEYYHPRSKYAFVVMEANEREAALFTQDFGDQEHGDSRRYRLVRWVNATDVGFRWKRCLHLRIQVSKAFQTTR